MLIVSGEAAICNIDHFFCTCPRIAQIWNPISNLIKRLLGTSDSDSNIIRINVFVERFPGVVWLIGAFVYEVWNTKENSFNAEKFFGFLKFKFKTSKLGTPVQLTCVTSSLP